MKTSRASALGLFAALVLPSLAFAIDPPPGGGYPADDTALGTNALFSVGSTYPPDSTAIGFQALYSAIAGSGENTAVGSNAMFSNTTGGANVAVGVYAMGANTTGNNNVAIGEYALVGNTGGGLNVAIGNNALGQNASGFNNVAVGFDVMSFSSGGTYNTAIGNVAMAFSTGSENVAVGDAALNQSSGSQNIGIGQSACLKVTGNNNIGIGELAGQNVTTGANNFMVGQNAGQNITTGSNNIEIDSLGTKKDNGVVRLGDTSTQKQTFIAGISGTTIPKGVAVVVDSKGQLGVATSSARFKDDIQPMEKASEAILSLQPVTFRYKKELDSLGTAQFGLVAEQVAKVDPDLVARDESGQPCTVRYEAVNAMLLNEFLKEHRKVEEQSHQAALQNARVESLEAKVAKLEAMVEKVNTRQTAEGNGASRVASTNE
jgi:hypothetical protein